MKTLRPTCECPDTFPGEAEFYTWAGCAREDTALIKKALPHLVGSASCQPFPLSGFKPSLLLNKGWFVVVTIQWWVLTPL